MDSSIATEWQQAKASIFWGEIAPTDHVVQIYENNNVLLDALAGFAGAGINAGDSVIVIATEEHLAALEKIFYSLGVNVKALVSESRYFPLNAEHILQKFMVNDWPDELLFQVTIKEIVTKAKKGHRKVRAFGEMVALLWAKGLTDATLELERLWTRFCEKESLGLFCAYPKNGFTEDPQNSIHQVCNCHNKVVNGEVPSMINVLYRSAN